MKIRETLTIQQTANLFNGNVVGFFPTMILDDDVYSSLKYDLCLGYYLERSGDKIISPTYERLMELKLKTPSIQQTPDEILGTIIRNKFRDKWTREYNALITEQYNPLYDLDETENRTLESSRTKGIDLSETKERDVTEDVGKEYTDEFKSTNDETIDASITDTNSHSSTDNFEGSSSSTDNYEGTLSSKTQNASKIVKQFDDETDDNVFGFNSTNSVPSSTSSTSSTETTTADLTDNTTEKNDTDSSTKTISSSDNSTKTITSSDTKTVNEDNKKTAEITSNKSFSEDATLTKKDKETITNSTDEEISNNSSETRTLKSRRRSASELIDMELDMRNRQLFFDIVYRDIDTVATISIYTEKPDKFNPVKDYVLISKVITENGTYIAVNDNADGYYQIRVDVRPNLKPLSVTENGRYTPTDSQGFSSVDVDVEYITTPLTITENGEYTPSQYSSDGFGKIIVSVSSGIITYYTGEVRYD